MSDAACSHMFVIEWMSLTLYVLVSMEGETEKTSVRVCVICKSIRWKIRPEFWNTARGVDDASVTNA